MEIAFTYWLTVAIAMIAATLIYTYVLFPLAMAFIGQRQSSPILRSDSLPSVTLIIPAHNEEKVIKQKIQNSLELDYPDLEIIVASDKSTDRTVEITRSFEKVTCLDFKTRRGKASVVADAIAQSRGDVLCLCDANVMFQADALWRLVSRLICHNAGGVTGDVRLESKKSSFGLGEMLYYQLERCIQHGESTLNAVIGVDGGMYVIRRELFHKLPADTILDDFSVSMHVLRSGAKLLYEPTAIANENSTEFAMDEFRRRVRIGVGASQVLCRGVFPSWRQPSRLLLFVSHKLFRWISPWLLLGLLFASIALSIYEPLALAILLPGLALASVAFVGAILPHLRQYWVVAVPFYFVLSQIALAWGLVKGLLFDSSGIWSRTSRNSFNDDFKNAEQCSDE